MKISKQIERLQGNQDINHQKLNQIFENIFATLANFKKNKKKEI